MENYSNITNWQGFMNLANTNTGGWFWTLMGAYLPFIIASVVLLPFGWEAALLVAGMIGLALSIILAYASLVSWWVVGSFVGVEIFMIILIAYMNRFDY